MRTSELIGPALDWAVAKCEGFDIDIHAGAALTIRHDGDWWSPSIDWAQGGPIIEREGMSIGMVCEYWQAHLSEFGLFVDGPTPLIAAMRCYVASKLGDEVDVPNELL